MKFLIGILIILLAFEVNAATGDNCTIFTQSDVAATIVSTRVLVANPARRCLMIQNKGSSAVFIKFGSAHSAFEGFSIPTATRWEPQWIPVNSLYIKETGGSDLITIIEGQ